MTLVEALAGIGLLGTLLVAILVAESRANRQAWAADRQMEACRAADELLHGWWAERKPPPAAGRGDVPGRDGWQWRTHTRPNPAAEQIGAQVVVLEVLRRGEAEPAVTLELLAGREGPDGP